MNCKDCSEKLDRYVDRELNGTEVLELQLHLDGCPDCADHYEFQAARSSADPPAALDRSAVRHHSGR